MPTLPVYFRQSHNVVFQNSHNIHENHDKLLKCQCSRFVGLRDHRSLSVIFVVVWWKVKKVTESWHATDLCKNLFWSMMDQK